MIWGLIVDLIIILRNLRFRDLVFYLFLYSRESNYPSPFGYSAPLERFTGEYFGVKIAFESSV